MDKQQKQHKFYFLVTLIIEQGLVRKVLTQKLKILNNNSEECGGVFRNEFCARKADSKFQKMFKISMYI